MWIAGVFKKPNKYHSGTFTVSEKVDILKEKEVKE